MKFLCEQCKAKYQIADEKVAGKTVRMKCRKCGHLIEMRAAVNESNASTYLPSPASVAPAGTSSLPPKVATKPVPRPTTLGASLTAPRPAASKVDRAPTGLAGAFKASVQRDDENSAPFDMSELSPGDDWYVAINGVPVGPVRIAEVRRKAALGALNEESLVWQEGLDEWQPLRTFPELVAIVREVAQSSRMGSLTPGPADGRISAPPAPRGTSTRPGAPLAPRAPLPRGAPLAPAGSPRNNVVPFTSRLATAERLDDPEPPTGLLAARPAALGSQTTETRTGSVLHDPTAAAAAVGGGESAPSAGIVPNTPAAPTTTTTTTEGAVAVATGLGAREAKAVPWVPLAMVVLAAAFGITAAIALFWPKPLPPAPVVIQVPAAPVPPPSANAQPSPSAASSSAESPTAPPMNTAPPRAAQGQGSSGTPRTAPSSSGPQLNLHGLAGPAIAPLDNPNEGPKAPGQCFSEGQVQQVIGQHQVAIRRACWERSTSTKPTVNVSVTLTIGPDGTAQSVSTSSDEPSIAKCIENDVRGWRFAQMGCSQKTGFSFKFVRQ